jgi:hypothetical protein
VEDSIFVGDRNCFGFKGSQALPVFHLVDVLMFEER